MCRRGQLDETSIEIGSAATVWADAGNALAMPHNNQ
jgi:hypothetical protein